MKTELDINIGPVGRDGKRRWALVYSDTVIACGKARTYCEAWDEARRAQRLSGLSNMVEMASAGIREILRRTRPKRTKRA